jgi:YtkA-like protein
VLVRLAYSQRRLARLVATGGLLAAAMIAAACHRAPAPQDTSAVVVAAHLLPPAPSVGPARLTITLSGATADLLGQANVGVVGYMTHPGMTPAVATVTRREPDIYDAALDLSMPGDWVLVATVRLPDGRRLESKTAVRVQARP